MSVMRASKLLVSMSIVGAVAFADLALAAQGDDASAIARTIKSDVAQLIAGINAHDVVRATAFDAPDIISMESGRPSSTGLEAERAGLGFAFAHNPDWRVSLVDETVDVASAGDMAIYRGVYNQDSSQAGVPVTQKVNFIAAFKRQGDGSWKVMWSIVSEMERPHKK